MIIYYDVSEKRPGGERQKRTEKLCGGDRSRVADGCSRRGNISFRSGRPLAYFVIGLSFFASHVHGETHNEVSTDPTRAGALEGDQYERVDREVVPVNLVERLRDIWRAEAFAGTSDARLSEEHRTLLVDALSRVNWTPFCSYTEESIVPDSKEARIKRHTFEFDQHSLEELIEQAAESSTDLDAGMDGFGSGGFESSLDEFAGMREDLAAAKVVDSSDLTVIYELPVPNELLEEDASTEGLEARFMKRLMKNLRVHFSVDAKNRGPKEIRIELLKPVRAIPGVKMKKMNFTTNFRFLEDVQEFAVDRNASEISIRAFLVAGFNEEESKTLSDFRCIQKG